MATLERDVKEKGNDTISGTARLPRRKRSDSPGCKRSGFLSALHRVEQQSFPLVAHENRAGSLESLQCTARSAQ